MRPLIKTLRVVDGIYGTSYSVGDVRDDIGEISSIKQYGDSNDYFVYSSKGAVRVRECPVEITYYDEGRDDTTSS